MYTDLVDVSAQMEDWTSHNKEVQTEDIPSCSIGTQTDIQAKDILTHHDPILLNLQEELTKAWLALE